MFKRLVFIWALEAIAVLTVFAVADVSFFTIVAIVTVGYAIGALHISMVDDGIWE